MSRLLLLLALLVVFWWLRRWWRLTPSTQRRRRLRQVLIWGGVGLLALAALSGRLNPLIALLGALGALMLRVLSLAQGYAHLHGLLRTLGLGGGAYKPQPGMSLLRSRFLELRFDQTQGHFHGLVREGPFSGRRLEVLDLEALARMLELYRERDPPSVALLETYLDQRFPGAWRARCGGNSSQVHGAGAPPDRAEASAILGVALDADAETVRAAHRRLMLRLHPDRGGSDYLASRINAARRVLLGE